jgi:hypothetical protein
VLSNTHHLVLFLSSEFPRFSHQASAFCRVIHRPDPEDFLQPGAPFPRLNHLPFQISTISSKTTAWKNSPDRQGDSEVLCGGQ